MEGAILGAVSFNILAEMPSGPLDFESESLTYQDVPVTIESPQLNKVDHQGNRERVPIDPYIGSQEEIYGD